MAPVRFLCARGLQLCLQIPLLIPSEDVSSPQRHWQAVRRGFWDVFSGSPVGSQGQGRSCHAPELSVWEGRGAVLQMAPASTGWHLPGWQSPRSFADILLSCSVFPKRPKELLKSLSTSHRLCFGFMVAQAPQPAGSCRRRRRRALPRSPRAPAPGTGCAASSASRSSQGLQIPACCCLPLPPPPPPPPPAPYLAGRGQGCCRRRWSRHRRGMSRAGRRHGAGSPAAGEALGQVPEHPMLRRPDWKRTRQARGSSWRLISLCAGKRGSPGRESPFSGL